MRVQRVTPTKNYTKVSNELARDSRLSWKARGIFLYLWSNTDAWDYHANEVANHATDGKDSLESGIKELEKYGYIKRVQRRDKGKFKGYMWLIYYQSKDQRPTRQDLYPKARHNNDRTVTGKSVNGLSVAGKPATNKNNLQLEQSKSEEPAARTKIIGMLNAYWGIPQVFLDETCDVVDDWLAKFSPDTILKTIDATNMRQLKQGKIKKPVNYINVVLNSKQRAKAKKQRIKAKQQSSVTTINDEKNKEKQHELKIKARARALMRKDA